MIGGPPLGTLDIAGTGPAVLALHGFGATTQEVLLVVEIARELGLRAHAPLLPGHGSSVHDLARMRFSDWHGAAERALATLLHEHEQVIVVGSSMGSLLALDLAADHPDQVAGVAVLGSPIRLHWPYPTLALAAISLFGVPDFTLRKKGPDILDPEARRTQVTYSEQPVYAGNDVRLAGRRVEGRLGEVRCPAFVAHGRCDRVCPVRNARRVYAQLGSVAWQKELLILERSHHIITRDVERGLLRTRLRAFIQGIAVRLPRGERVASEWGGARIGDTEPNPDSDAGGPVSAFRSIGLR
jgi:carboxylesterase